LISLGVKLITSRMKHPRTNGNFDSLNDFVYWYNDVRFEESLEYQTPEDAFWSRLPVEARSGVAFKLF